MDEALHAVQKLLELQPDTAGYYDTLAYVYAGKGDLANAVKAQAWPQVGTPIPASSATPWKTSASRREEKKKSEAATGPRQ